MRCPDCDHRSEVDRREFIRTVAVGGVGLVTTAAPKLYGSSETSLVRPKAKERSETLVATLYKSLSEEQKQKVAFPFDHPLRSKVDNNWQITPVTIAEFFTPDQQAMIAEIFRGLHNPEFVDKVLYHINEDAGGLGKYSVALFGEPGGAFEFVLTGRHCTARCDGDSVEGAAFGGPIFYGHQAGPTFEEKPEHPNNVYWYQAKRANEVFQALSGKQRELALVAEPRPEKATETVALKKKSELVGLPVGDMTRDQKHLVEKVLADLLMPFRKKDTDEAMRFIKDAGGV